MKFLDFLFFYINADGGTGCLRIRAETEADAMASAFMTDFVRSRIHNVQRVECAP